MWMYWEAPIADVDIDVDTHSTMSTVTELPAELKAEAESEALKRQSIKWSKTSSILPSIKK